MGGKIAWGAACAAFAAVVLYFGYVEAISAAKTSYASADTILTRTFAVAFAPLLIWLVCLRSDADGRRLERLDERNDAQNTT